MVYPITGGLNGVDPYAAHGHGSHGEGSYTCMLSAGRDVARAIDPSRTRWNCRREAILTLRIEKRLHIEEYSASLSPRAGVCDHDRGCPARLSRILMENWYQPSLMLPHTAAATTNGHIKGSILSIEHCRWLSVCSERKVLNGVLGRRSNLIAHNTIDLITV